MKKLLLVKFVILFLLLMAMKISADGGGYGRHDEITPGPPGPTATPVPLDAMFRPYVIPWLTEDKPWNTGACPRLSGSGWSGTVTLPVSGTYHEGRLFRRNHTAVDIDAPFNSDVYAGTSGVVIWAGFHINGYGNLIVLGHGNGWQTFYAHLDDVYVQCGEYVIRGEVIGTTGRTGGTSFDHLHFEVRNGDWAYNPLRYLP